MSLFTAWVCVLIYGVLNHPWKSRGGGLEWFPAHKSHAGWGHTAAQSTLPHFAGISLLPKQDLGELRPKRGPLDHGQDFGKKSRNKIN